MDWANLPEPAVTRILSFLSLRDRCIASSACATWRDCLSSPDLWETTVFKFRTSRDEKLLKFIFNYGHLIKNLSIQVDQFTKENRDNACSALQCLARFKRRRLNSFSLIFIGENPTFYAGAEFECSLKELFSVGECPQFLSIDLGGIKMTITGRLLNTIVDNNPCIEKLNIQPDALICKTSPDCLKRAVERCRCLRDLSVISCSMTDEVLRLFTEKDRKPLEHLSIMTRREQKFSPPISSEAWAAIRTSLPHLKVALGFDSTCPMDVVADVLKPEIPVYSVKLAVYAPVEDSMLFLPIFYKDTVETLILHPMSNKKFHIALESVAKRCLKLRTLLVYCVLPEDLIQRILENCPEIRKRGTYILKSAPEPEDQWIMAKDSPNWSPNM